MSVPAGSVLVIRASGKVQFDVVTTGGLSTEVARPNSRPQSAAGTDERRFIITDRGTATVRGLSERRPHLAFNAIPDRPPTIALTKDPEPQARGSLQLCYKIEDDYGVVDAQRDLRAQGRRPRPPASRRRVRCSGRPSSRCRCRRRASATASARPPRI